MKKRQKMVDPGEFRQRMAARQKQQRHERYLHAAVSLCEKFDQEKVNQSLQVKNYPGLLSVFRRELR